MYKDTTRKYVKDDIKEKINKEFEATLPKFPENKQNIIFIHGYGGPKSSAWKFWRKERVWDEFYELIRQDIGLNGHVDLHRFEHTAPFFTIPGIGKKRPLIQTTSKALKTFIQANNLDNKRTTFVCHSMGGLIARQMALDLDDASCPHKIENIIMYATPNNGSELATVAKTLLPLNTQVRQLKPSEEFITTLNTRWALKNMNDKINLVYVIGDQDRIVSVSSAQQSWGNDISICVGDNHSTIIRPKEQDKTSYKVFRQTILGAI
ncbi:MAG: alpha/beta fold hydrolase [Candidatus Thiodiazotropha sp.]